jgi:serine protease Do
VVLSDVYPGGPAAEAGLRTGDVVSRLDGKVMENGRQLRVDVYRGAPGQKVRLEVLRGTETLEIDVPVVERQDDPDRFLQMVTPEENLIARLGILAVDLERAAGLVSGLRAPSGVLVAARAAETAVLGEDELQPGDVIYALNAIPIGNLNDLRAVLSTLRAGDPVVLLVERAQELIFVALELQS